MKEKMTEIVGNDTLKKRLCDDILSGTLSHACILEGEKGSGRHTLARMCAAALACSHHHDDSLPIPCLTCHDCRKILEGKSPDVILIGNEGKATLSVETIRALREDVHVVPNDLDYKIYIIENADTMTVYAQNALLLTLEEPPSYVRFFLLCENAGLLLETIRSRAPVMRMQPIATEDIDRYLCDHDRRAAQMKLASPKDYDELLMASGASIGKALEYLNPKAFAPVLERRRLVAAFTEAATKGDGAKVILPLLSRFPTKRDQLNEVLQTLSDAVRDLLVLKKSDHPPLTFYRDLDTAITICDRVSLPFLYEFYQAVRNAIDENNRNANVRLAVTKLAAISKLI